MTEHKWIRSSMDLYFTDINSKHIVEIKNSGNLDLDFYKYAKKFFDAAECVIHYLGEEAADNQDIAKLDLWYFSMIYLYRQSLELLLKACLFQTITDNSDKKRVVGEVRHDLEQAFKKLVEEKNLTIDYNENSKWLNDYLADISRIDRESDMFRYPFGSNLKTLFDSQKNISLIATHDNMNKAYNIIKYIYDTGMFPSQTYDSYEPLLFIEGGNYYQQSVVGYKYAQNSFYPYYSSYEEVGIFLKETITKDKKYDLFMPMCYLFRNAIELGLKRLIVEDSHMEYSKSLKIIRKKKHSILGLWNSISEEINEYANAPEDDTTLEDTHQYILAFHNFDQRSDLFRYPCNKDMESYFLISKKFDIENVSSCFEELCNFLNAVDTMLLEIKDYEAEMASYYDYY